MIGKLFRSHKRSRPERPSFRPFLESLENREVPSSLDASAAYDRLPTDMNNLVTSLQARPTEFTTINTNLVAVTNDIALLSFSARNFVVSDRLLIDNALVTNGLTMVYQAFFNYPHFASPLFVNVLREGVTAVEQGGLDFLITGFFPQSSNDAILT